MDESSKAKTLSIQNPSLNGFKDHYNYQQKKTYDYVNVVNVWLLAIIRLHVTQLLLRFFF